MYAPPNLVPIPAINSSTWLLYSKIFWNTLKRTLNGTCEADFLRVPNLDFTHFVNVLMNNRPSTSDDSRVRGVHFEKFHEMSGLVSATTLAGSEKEIHR